MNTIAGKHLIICVALGFVFAGCDASDPDPAIVVTGRAIIEGTGEPILGLGVVLRNTGGVGSSIVIAARTETQADGTFRIVLAEPKRDAFTLSINDDPYNGCYGRTSQIIQFGTRLDLGDVELTADPPNQTCNR
jgi:hypothetical protein